MPGKSSILPDLPWDLPDPYVIDVVVAADQIDMLGHANNLHYLGWLQECAWAHSAARGVDGKHMVRLGYAMAVRETRMTYLGATFEGDRLRVGDWITACDGRLRAQRSFQIIRESDRRTVMRAVIDYVCITIDSGKPARMPPEFVAAYAEDLRGPVP